VGTLEHAVKHDGRLNLLCCLLRDGPMALDQIAARTGESIGTVRYWIGLLETVGLVERQGAGPRPLYDANLGGQPAWVLEAVAKHRPRMI
jgi:predicted ArsR family transcriptional regulator